MSLFVRSVQVEGTFMALAARKLTDLDQWYLLIPGFVVASLFWLICHMVFVITLWGFHTKLSDCQRLSWSQGPGVSGLDKVMASKGMRHFCLISERLVLFTLVSSVSVAALCWQVRLSRYNTGLTEDNNTHITLLPHLNSSLSHWLSTFNS